MRHAQAGNLTNDGTFSYTYDAENRMIAATPLYPVTGSKKLKAGYDYQGRRVQKRIFTYNAGTWVLESTKAFTYDGWNVIQETTTTGGNTSTEDYVWGLDLSGSLQGAGGIGGLLLWKKDTGTFLYLYDANGNVGQLVNSSTGEIAARYEYDPFGKTLVADGPEAWNNPFRYSTKYFDSEIGLYDYGHRYYSPKLGRWMTRDPIEEAGGINLYGFVRNNPMGGIDVLGLFCPGAVPYTEATYGVGNSEFDISKWTTGKLIYSVGILARTAMDHADCSLSGDWVLSPAECEQTEHQLFNYAEDCALQTTCPSKRLFAEWFEDYIYSNYNSRPSGSYDFQIPGRIIRFGPKFSDQYFAYGKAELTFTGTVHLCKGWWGTSFNIDMEIDLSDDFTFSWYRNLGTTTLRSPTAIGYRLETAGYLRRFNIMGKWKKENMYVFYR